MFPFSVWLRGAARKVRALLRLLTAFPRVRGAGTALASGLDAGQKAPGSLRPGREPRPLARRVGQAKGTDENHGGSLAGQAFSTVHLLFIDS